MIRVRDVHVTFGRGTPLENRALRGLDLTVPEGEFITVIGSNGAGKSTTFNCISRYYRPTSGSITFDGADITGKKPHEMAALGVARTFQNLELFGALSVRENALLGTYAHGAN
ncbi:ATP-binding cassette domain-containing protein, partial [Paenibacillus polymyxa]|nr:ATP-binding cassette domain-containing protein [Paenibacillus polymyxa]